MLRVIIFVSTLVAYVFGRPNYIDVQNIVTVPPNCPDGQEYINGQCRDIWRGLNEPHNLAPESTICPTGQEWIDYRCSDKWQNQDVNPSNVVTVPPNCPNGQEYINGQCRDIWRGLNDLLASDGRNIVTVRPNCPSGQEWVNGQCRDIWRSSSRLYYNNAVINTENHLPVQQANNEITTNTSDKFINFLNSVVKKYVDGLRERRNIAQINEENILSIIEEFDQKNRNIISVPNQCPNGTRPDALGICREIFD